jgi:hypothetical protein
LSQLTFTNSCIILDACSLINLYVTDEIASILAAIPVRCVVCSFVKDKETLYINTSNADGSEVRTPIDLEPLITMRLLEVVQPNLRELSNQLILLAANDIRDGEQISGALAVHNNWAMATDDRPARNKLAMMIPSLQLVSSLELVQLWENTNHIAPNITQEVLVKILMRGKYKPKKADPLYMWFMDHTARVR